MIIQNGTIEFKKKTDGVIDEDTGYRTKLSSVEYLQPIACHYVPIKVNEIARAIQSESNYTQMSFFIFIEQGDYEMTGIVRLKDKKGSVIGEFSVVQVQELDAVCQIKITI